MKRLVEKNDAFKGNPSKMTPENILKIIKEFIDFVVPELTPAEAAVYLLLMRQTILENDSLETRIGKRTIAEKYGQGVRGTKTNFGHINRLLKQLITKGCISVGDVNREGTLYRLILPKNIPFVSEKLKSSKSLENDDYFNPPNKRQEIFERDNWRCSYCGEKVDKKNVTLDHFIPQSKGGTHSKENLKTACLVCNSIKTGKSYEEAASYLLKSIQARNIQRG